MKLFARGFLFCTILICLLFYINYGDDWNLFYADALGYYSYLPSAFIYHNFGSFESLPTNQNIPPEVIDYFLSFQRDTPSAPTGNYMNRYTYGVALLQLPFFSIAHVYCYLLGLPTIGYTAVYENIVRTSSLFYSLAGLFILYRALRKFFNNEVSIITACLILLGSNLFWFTFYQVGMSHSYLFFLHALLVLSTIYFYEKPSVLKAFGIGLLLGVITITRQPDIIFVLLPILFGVFSVASFKERLIFIKKNIPFLLVVMLGFLLPLLPQLILWKVYAGSFIYFSYSGQGFSFLQPHILAGLFGANNGWLLYSPLFIFSIMGFFYTKKIRVLLLPGLLIFILFIYIAYAWWCYWYMFGFGSRPLLSLYPLLAFPLAAFISWVSQGALLKKGIALGLLILAVLISLNLTWAAVENRIQSDDTNYAFFLNTFYKHRIDYNDLVLLDTEQQQPDTSAIQLIASAPIYTFENNVDTSHLIFDTSLQSTVCVISQGEEFAPQPFTHLLSNNEKTDYIKCSAQIKIDEHFSEQPLLTLSVKRGDSTLIWKSIKLNNKIGWQEAYCHHKKLSLKHAHEKAWDSVSFFVDVRTIKMQQGDIVEYGIWNIPKGKIAFDDVCLELYKIKN